jgi:hypothetical protein
MSSDTFTDTSGREYERLIVAFGISDGLLAMTPICQGKGKCAYIPLIVLLLLQGLDPHIRDSHGEPVIEADASK